MAGNEQAGVMRAMGGIEARFTHKGNGMVIRIKTEIDRFGEKPGTEYGAIDITSREGKPLFHALIKDGVMGEYAYAPDPTVEEFATRIEAEEAQKLQRMG